MTVTFMRLLWRTSLVFVLGFVGAAAAAETKSVAENDDYYATVGEQRITMQEYRTALQAGMRKRFYHGKISEPKVKAFRDEIGQTLIDRVLLLGEAKRRGIRPDDAALAQQMKEYEARFSHQAAWRDHGEELRRGLREALAEEDVLRRLERQVREGPALSAADIKAYYERHPDLFTTPEAFRVSLIMLKVDPSSPPKVWDAAHDEARGLIEKLRRGSDFAQLARIHSGDESAAEGGDMGFLHKGMLAEPAQQAIDRLAPGEISEPVLMLQGVAIFRLEARRPHELNAFDSVRDRARLLLERERGERAWQRLVEGLRQDIKVTVNTAAVARMQEAHSASQYALP